MAKIHDAPLQQDGPIPAYKVAEIEGPFVRQISQFDEKSKQIVKQDVTFDPGYMVFFPKGHSHMYPSKEALIRAGFGEIVPLINMSQEAEVNKEHPAKTIHREIEKVSK